MNNENNKRTEAIEIYKKYNLDYKDITVEDIRKLIKMINCSISSNDDSVMYLIELPKKKNIKFKNNLLISAEIRVAGNYFTDREAITFYEDGYIGFCGWADGFNSSLIINPFIDWCYYLKSKKEVSYE